MFGIGLPELILILALALIVVGPDKLPDLARSVAKGVLDLKKTANSLKESLTEHGNPLDDIKPELEDAARALKDDVMRDVDKDWEDSRQDKVTGVIDIDVDTVTDVEEQKPTETKS
jgi:sec-independent protein translocase protein TatB